MKMKIKIKNVALRVRLVVFAISLLSIVLPAAAVDHILNEELAVNETYTYSSSTVGDDNKRYWEVISDDTTIVSVSPTTKDAGKGKTSAFTCTLTAKKAGSTTVHVKSGTNSAGTERTTINVTVKSADPVKGAVAYADYEIPYEGDDVEAKANVGVNKDTVLIFKSGTGVFTVPVDMVANVLVVGGGGSGACGSGSGYYGGSGAGGAGKLETGIEFPAGAYAVSVGAGGASVPQKTTTGKKGGDSSLSGEGSFEAISGAGGAAGSGSSSSPSANGNGCKITTDITGTSVTYGTGGAKATKAETPVNGAHPGDGGQGNYYKYSSGAGADGIVVVRITEVAKVCTPIDVPTATTAFTFDNTPKTCVAAGAYYTRGGTYEATNAGDYTATVTPDDDHCWTGGSRAPVEIKWTVARRPATVTVVNTNKVEGAVFVDPDQQAYNDPIWTTTTEGLIAGDTADLTWDIFRTNACEEVGTYDLLVEGEKKQGNYELTFVGGKYEICEAPPPETEIAVPTAIAGLVFNGQPQKGVADGDGYTLVNDVATPAGAYTAVATLEDGYVWSDGSHEPKEIAWSIAKAVYDLSGVTFDNTTVTYNGQERTITVSEGTLPQGVQAVCDGVGTNAGVYAVTVVFTGDDNYETMTNWTVQLTIGRAPAVVTAVSTNKFAGADDPTFTATETGRVDDFKLVYDVVRTNASEAVGFYDLVPQGEVEQGNYTVSYRKGTFEIKPIPTFTITITRGAGIADITNGTASVFSGAEKSAAIEFETGTQAVTLMLAADHMTIPVYKVVTNDITTVTSRTATYEIFEGCTLTFMAEEAKVDDPAVTDEQTTAAIIAAIDGEEGEKTHDDAVAKVETITAGEEGERAVEPKDLATWITDKQISSTSIAQSDYVAASVHLDTSAPITDRAEVEITEVEEVSSDAFTFAFEVTLEGNETPEELNLVKEFVAGCIETTGDLGEGFAETVDPKRVKIEDGKVVITPDPTKTAEFFKIVIPRDPTR